MHNCVWSSSTRKVGVAVMEQITSHVDWSLSSLLVVIALGQFLLYSIRLYERRVMSALVYMGLGCISAVTSVGINLPRLINEGVGIAGLPVLACLVVGLVGLTVGVIGSISSLIGNYLSSRRRKNPTAVTATRS